MVWEGAARDWSPSHPETRIYRDERVRVESRLSSSYPPLPFGPHSPLQQLIVRKQFPFPHLFSRPFILFPSLHSPPFTLFSSLPSLPSMHFPFLSSLSSLLSIPSLPFQATQKKGCTVVSLFISSLCFFYGFAHFFDFPLGDGARPCCFWFGPFTFLPLFFTQTQFSYTLQLIAIDYILSQWSVIGDQ